MTNSAARGFRATLTLLAILTAGALAQVDTAWVRRFSSEGPAADEANALAADRLGNVFVTGSSPGPGSGADFLTLKYSADGQLLWAARLNGPGNSTDAATAACTDASGNVYVTGYTTGAATGLDYTTAKYSPAGTLCWAARFNGSGSGSDVPAAVAVDASGSVYVTGYSTGVSTGLDYATVKYDSAGTEQWVRFFTGSGANTDAATALCLDRSGNVWVTGYSFAPSAFYDYATVKYDPTGAQLAVMRYNGTGNRNDVACAIGLDSAGDARVTGYSYGMGTADYDYATVRYSSGGTQLWAARYNGSADANDEAAALALDLEGNVFVTGASTGTLTGYDYLTVRYGRLGSPDWARRENGRSSGTDRAAALALDPEGNVGVTGSSDLELGFGFDWRTLKYSADGNQLWSARYSGSGSGTDQARAIGFDRDGSAFVCGSSLGAGTGLDVVTIKYLEPDAAVAGIVAPAGRIDTNATIVPQVRVVNLGTGRSGFSVWLRILNSAGTEVYARAETISGLARAETALVTLPEWPRPHGLGLYTCRCSVWVANDRNRSNDVFAGSVTLVGGLAGWSEVYSMPLSPSGRGAKSGAGLRFHPGAGMVYALKGGKTGDFYAYQPLTNTWTALPSTEPGPSGKLPGAGASLAACGGHLYVVKGNNTCEFWRFSLDDLHWQRLADIPTAPSGKDVKDCSGLAFVPALGSGFLLKGPRNDLCRYDLAADGWEVLPSAPAAACPKWGKGSSLVFDGSNSLWAVQAGTNALFRFDLVAGQWDTLARLPALPLVGRLGKSKKVKDGGCAVWHDGAIYALKGGSTQELWRYWPALGRWEELDTIPAVGSTAKKVRVKGGAAISSAGFALYALKGGNTLEFWRYNFGVGRSGERGPAPQARHTEPASSGPAFLRLAPNPARGLVCVYASRPGRLDLFDSGGRRVLSATVTSGETGVSLAGLASGVYVCRLGTSAARLVIAAGP